MKLLLDYKIRMRFKPFFRRFVGLLSAFYLVDKTVLCSDPIDLIDHDAFDLVVSLTVGEVEACHDRKVVIIIFVQFDKEFSLFFREVCFT